MGARFSRNRNHTSRQEAGKTPSGGDKGEKHEFKPAPAGPPAPPAYEPQPPHPTTPPSAPAPGPTPASPSQAPAVAPAPAENPPKLAGQWFCKCSYTWAGEITVHTSDERTIGVEGDHLTTSSRSLRKRLTRKLAEPPITHLYLDDRDLETWPVVRLYVDLLEGRELVAPPVSQAEAVLHEKLAKLLVKYNATTQITAFTMSMYKWMTAQGVDPALVFRIGAIMKQSKLCHDVMSQCASWTWKTGQDQGRSVWDLSTWPMDHIASVPSGYKDALTKAFSAYPGVVSDKALGPEFANAFDNELSPPSVEKQSS